MSLIKENSYWFTDSDEEDAKIHALCEICHKKENSGWFWDGKRLGYGDYDLFCFKCGNAIHIRESEQPTSAKETT